MQGFQVVIQERGRVVVEKSYIPQPGAGEIVVRNHFTLISPNVERETVLALDNPPPKFPLRIGYNAAGEVAAVGKDVPGFAVGDRVVHRTPHASHVLLKMAAAIKVPADAPLDEAVFCPLTEIALQGVRRARIEIGEAVAVQGQGLLGQLALRLARCAGAMPLVAVDISDKRLAISRHGGADAGLNSRAHDFAARLASATDGRGPAVVFECTGLAEPVNAAFEICADGGRVVLLAGTRGQTKTDFYRDVHRKGITIIGAYSGARPQSERRPGAWTQREDTQVALKLLLSRRLDARPLVTHRFPGADAAKAYGALMDWREDLMGVLLDWR